MVIFWSSRLMRLLSLVPLSDDGRRLGALLEPSTVIVLAFEKKDVDVVETIRKDGQ
jgi:hypothetical protein